jgi:hypothetical protein
MSSLSLAKCTRKKTLPSRDKSGRFIKKTASSTELSDLTSEDSSLLDTPEISERTLVDQETTESEYEVTKQLEEHKDDEELLPGAPEPTTTIPIPEIILPTLEFTLPFPFPKTQHSHQFIVPSASKPRTPSKTSIVPSPIPVQIQLPSMATIPAPSVFSGNDNENPQNFLCEVERYIQLTRITDEATKVILFGTFISAGSQADIWWGSLMAQQTASWAAIKAVFEMQWPAIVVQYTFS